MKAGYSRLLVLSLFFVLCLAVSGLADIGAGTFTTPQQSQFINGSAYIMRTSNATGQTPFSNTTNVTFSYTRTTPSGGSITGIGVNISTDLINNANVNFPFDTTTVADGLYTLTAQYMNATGQTVSTTVTGVAVDNTAPSITRLKKNRDTVYKGKQDLDVACEATDPSDTTLVYELILRDEKNVRVQRIAASTGTFRATDFLTDGQYDLACIATTSNPQGGVANETVRVRQSSTTQIAIGEVVVSGDSRFQRLIGSPNAKVFLLLGGFVFFAFIVVAVYLVFFTKKKGR